ncbi:alpha/beta hydrolase [Phenylobacterium sp.]|uniref:alpha/beta hydrolase n=1 Tax=Phenylobacterium sp. TaxID=1871053 RepID=UPI00301C94E1
MEPNHRKRVMGSTSSVGGLVWPAAVALAVAGLLAVDSARSQTPPQPILNADGSLDVPGFRLPWSEYASPEARDEQNERLTRAQSRPPGPRPPRDPSDPGPPYRDFLEANRRMHPVTIANEVLGGVEVMTVMPRQGVLPKNARRVLINLHGGGFSTGWPYFSQLESVPIASRGRIKVVSVNYRMPPQGRYPDASEDIANVYRTLLKTYRPKDIGIYGCSAGGILTGQAVGWFDKVGLPQPGAVAIISGALAPAYGGDSAQITPHLGGYFAVPAPITPAIPHPYFAGASRQDPAVAPLVSPALLAKFPPTFIATGTRAADMSSSVHAHIQLAKAGADARLYLWDGVEHCFTYNPQPPESREAFDLMIRFFDETMDRGGSGGRKAAR